MSKQVNSSVKKVLAVHDLSGFGHTSLMAVIPILYRMGLEVAVLPSILLSANTDYDDYRRLDTTAFMLQTLEHWSDLKLCFDAVFSGFLGSPEEADILLDAIPRIKNDHAMVLVDPVLGDDGKLYGCYNDSMVLAMQKLLAVSDVITPNLTEAALLLGEPFPKHGERIDLRAWSSALAEMGPKMVVITSVPGEESGESMVFGYDRKTDESKLFRCRYLPIVYPGAGDCFSSLVLGGIMNGHYLWDVVQASVDYLSDAIALSMPVVTDRRTGISLSKALLINPLEYYKR